jgi:RNA polymerase sigma factor (sigma-70 family)
MIKIEAMDTVLQNDAELVAESLAGNKDAFRQIVERYQTLVCSLAYCATGNVSQSEDLAQETFVTAWKDLATLREPAKLRSWLCALARFRISKQLRRQDRDPIHSAEPLEVVDSFAAPEPPPRLQAITNEETALLWRSLEQIPEMYREPLVLFYREHQSIETVAANLDLTEDAAKQRLSRGRKMLQEQVTAFVEGALKKTTPGKTFAVGVLAALSLAAPSAKAATVGTAAAKVGTAAAKASAATKTGATFGSAGGFLPFLPIAGSFYLTWRANLEGTKSLRERQFMAGFFGILVISVFILNTLLVKLLAHYSFPCHRAVSFGILFFVSLIFVFILGRFARGRRRQIQIEDGTWVKPEPMTAEQRQEFLAKSRQQGSKWRLYLYLGMACNMAALVMLELNHLHNGWQHIAFLIFLSGFTLFLCVQAWRALPR